MRGAKLPRASALVAVGIISASCLARSKPSPLPDLHGVTRVIALPFEGASHEFRVPADSFRLAMLADALQQFPTGWTKSTDAPPRPDLGATFIRDSTIVAVVWIGPEFIAGFGGSERLARHVSRTEENHLRALLNPGTVIGGISNQAPPEPPQN